MSIKVGIIGAGGMLKYHMAGCKAGADVVAIADATPGVASKAAASWIVPAAYDSVEEMFQRTPDLDAVSIIVPNKFHASLAIQCPEAGKHVFCEKPPALNAAEVETMIHAATTAGKRLMFNFNNRARPDSRAIMEYIRAGTVGHINSAQAKWIRRTGIPGFGGWFTSREFAGGGALIDLLHMIDLAMYFYGLSEPAHVLARTYDDFITDRGFKGPWGIPDREGGINDVEAAAHGFITFATGQALFIQTSWAEMVKREEASVVFQGTGAGGKVERLFRCDGLDETATDTCELYVQENGRSVNRSVVTPDCEDMGRIDSAANFIETLAGTAEPLNHPSEALKLMRVIDAIFASAASGAPVTP